MRVCCCCVVLLVCASVYGFCLVVMVVSLCVCVFVRSLACLFLFGDNAKALVVVLVVYV